MLDLNILNTFLT